jgi:hypothetical protein
MIMENIKIVEPYYDLKKQSVGQTSFFFLQHILMARSDLHMESGYHEHDQEVNVYLCGLMNSLVDTESLTRAREYISTFDFDVRQYLDEHPGVRNEYIVYRDNADFGLLQEGVFQGDEHPGSYHHIVFQDTTRQERIGLYYELAASALSHLHGPHGALVPVFMSLAEHMPEILKIVRRAAGYYFEMIERLSEGSLFHLEREMNEKGMMKQYQELLDEFLKAYREYRAAPSEQESLRLQKIASELRILNSNFRCDELNRQ